LSTENLKNRTQTELDYLFWLYKKTTEALYEIFRKFHINFCVAGDITKLPEKLVKFLNEKMEELHYPDSKKTFVMAINY
jgi:undecaprenyl pyrophosphate synthase